MNGTIRKAMEKRQHQRFACYEEVVLTVNDRSYSGIMLNISNGGFFVLTSLPFSPGDTVELSYFSGTRRDTISYDGTIVRRENSGIGIQI